LARQLASGTSSEPELAVAPLAAEPRHGGGWREHRAAQGTIPSCSCLLLAPVWKLCSKNL
ncbi:MAG: hypothetical protein ACPIOQ_80935, partial [Promethearchaeia archaeon]